MRVPAVGNRGGGGVSKGGCLAAARGEASLADADDAGVSLLAGVSKFLHYDYAATSVIA